VSKPKANLKFYFSNLMERRHKAFVNFVQMMANRLMVGFYRYGDVKHQKDYRRYNYFLRAQKALQHYDDTGNTEFLVDAANYCWLEFCVPSHPKAFFACSDSEGSRTEPDR
jgi:hypothetical protein